jgi:hypothetical protein
MAAEVDIFGICLDEGWPAVTRWRKSQIPFTNNGTPDPSRILMNPTENVVECAFGLIIEFNTQPGGLNGL